jgi:hypothetical protein
MALGKGRDDKGNPLHFSGEMKDWPTFKEAIQSRADTLTPRDYVTPRVRTGSSAVLCQSNQEQDWLRGDAQKGAREHQD